MSYVGGRCTLELLSSIMQDLGIFDNSGISSNFSAFPAECRNCRISTLPAFLAIQAITRIVEGLAHYPCGLAHSTLH